MKSKVRPFFAIFIILFISTFSFYIGVDLFNEYFSFDNTVVFSWFSFFMLALPFIMIFPLFYFVFFFFKGSEYAFIKMDDYLWLFKFACLFTIILGVSFSLFYTSNLSNKGYIKCSGIPSGWMPGMATKYALNESLCLKKRL